MNANRGEGCSEEHVTGASEFHSDGRLCGEWLSDQERTRLSPDQCSLTMEMVMRDQFDNWGTLDRGQLLRLQKSLSLTQPRRRRIKEISISLTPPRFKIEFE